MPEEGRRNSAGELLHGPRILRDPSFGTGKFDSSGDPIVDWEKWQPEFADSNGFDVRNKEDNGEYYVEMKLPRGTPLIRFGAEGGRYTAPAGTKYEELSLPYTEKSQEYHEYEVIADSITVVCVVKRGRVAPMFNSVGGGIQYMHLHGSVRDLLRQKVLKRVPLWK